MLIGPEYSYHGRARRWGDATRRAIRSSSSVGAASGDDTEPSAQIATGIICRACRKAVADIERQHDYGLTLYCPSCGHRWA